MMDNERLLGDTLVIAEDDDFIRKALVRFLGHRFGRILSSASGSEALKLIQLHKPAAAILDMMLPGMDGCEVLGALRKVPESARLPVVMTSGMGAVGKDMLAEGTERCLYIPKPFDFEQIERGIEAMLEGASGAPDSL